jgi:uncharacterized iron-regulated membrane protein
MKIIVVLALLAIVGALAGAGTFMLRRRPHLPEAGAEPDRKMARALALRVALSVGIFLLVLLFWWLGWMTPGGLPVGR